VNKGNFLVTLFFYLNFVCQSIPILWDYNFLSNKKYNKPETLCCGEQVNKSIFYKFRTRFGIIKENGI